MECEHDTCISRFTPAFVALTACLQSTSNQSLRLLEGVLATASWSGKRDSNSRPQPWQGCALPTELFPHGCPTVCSLVATTALRPDKAGAGNETRTRDLNLGKVALYQLSYSRIFPNPLHRGCMTQVFALESSWSGKRDSNSRPQPWQGCALPTELFPLGRRNNTPLHAHVNTIYGLDFTFLRAACSSAFRLGQAAHRYCRPDHRVSSAAAASSQSPRWKTGSPSQISLVFCCPGVTE